MVERRTDIEVWLRDVSKAEDAVLPANLGSLPSDREKQSTQLHKPRINSNPLEGLPLVELTSTNFLPTGGFKTNKRKPK